jgi:hypothetical protein
VNRGRSMNYILGKNEKSTFKYRLTTAVLLLIVSIMGILPTILANQATRDRQSNSVNSESSSNLVTDTPEINNSNVSSLEIVDTQKPVGSVTYSGGKQEPNGIRYIKSISELSYTETTTDNVGVIRSTFLVQKFNTVNNSYELFCGNWNANSTGSLLQSGGTSESRTSNVAICRGSNSNAWPDGKYRIAHAAYDSAGNEGKYNTDRQEFVIDTERPVGTATYSGGQDVDGVFYIKSIDDLKYSEEITDNNNVVRATVLVQKLDPNTQKYESFCGNWNKNSLGSHTLNGATTANYEGDVKVCRSNDTSPWPDGSYKIIHGAYDAAGNEGKYNTERQEFVIDTERPVGIATYSGGSLVGDILYIRSIDDLKYSEEISDNVGVARATVLVQKYNTVTQKYESFCGNWNKNSLGSHTFNGMKTVTFNGDVKVCRSNDTSPWPDGKYRVVHGAYDRAGNEGKYNTDRQEFVIDTERPVGIATYSGGQDVDGVFYIKSIDDLKYSEEITDNNNVVRATVLVQKLDPNTQKYESFCGNWNKNSLGSHTLNGATTANYEGDVKVCRSNDTSPWPDGSYKIIHGAYDAAGNEGKYNTERQEFVIDSTRSEEPTLAVINTEPLVLGTNTDESQSESRISPSSSQNENNPVIAPNTGRDLPLITATTVSQALGTAANEVADTALSNVVPASAPRSSGSVLGSSDVTIGSEKLISADCGRILGTCWYYWLPTVLIVPISIFYMSVRRTKDIT